jgi:hypothetical protein
LGDRGARGQGRKVEAHESRLVVASGVANLDGWVGAHWLKGILIVGVSSVTLSVCANAELASAPMNAALSARDRRMLGNICRARIESPLVRKEMNCVWSLTVNI